MKERATFWSVLFVAALWLPLLQRSCGLVEEEDLHGVERSIAAPSLAAGSWLDGSFQAGFEAAFARDLGFHGHLVRTNNHPVLALHVDDVPTAIKVLSNHGFTLIGQDEIVWDDEKA